MDRIIDMGSMEAGALSKDAVLSKLHAVHL